MPTVSKTIIIVTKPALGIPAAPIEAAVAVMLFEFQPFEISIVKIWTNVYLIATSFPNDRSMPRNCAMNIAATAVCNKTRML